MDDFKGVHDSRETKNLLEFLHHTSQIFLLCGLAAFFMKLAVPHSQP